jgi:hypothetical protein
LCYAKITPAALHCGELDSRCLENVEAAGGRPEFWSGEKRRIAAG